jgi:hypothetical protein
MEQSPCLGLSKAVLVFGFWKRAGEVKCCRRYKPKSESALDRPHSLILCAVVTTLAQVVNMDEAGVVQRDRVRNMPTEFVYTKDTLSRPMFSWHVLLLHSSTVLWLLSVMLLKSPSPADGCARGATLPQIRYALVQRLSASSEWISQHLGSGFRLSCR